jgi:hypothetical protein
MADGSSGLSDTWKGRKLPKSCIESTCHAMQCITQDKWSDWKGADTTTNGPGVWAAFGNKLICISRVSNLPNELTGVTDCDTNKLGGGSFSAVMQPGRGLILANSGPRNQKFNMHLGAVIDRQIDGQDVIFTITDMSETGPVVNSPIEYLKLKNTELVNGFRGNGYGDPEVYKVGVLICEAEGDGRRVAELRQEYEAPGVEIIDESPSESSDSEA